MTTCGSLKTGQRIKDHEMGKFRRTTPYGRRVFPSFYWTFGKKACIKIKGTFYNMPFRLSCKSVWERERSGYPGLPLPPSPSGILSPER